VGGVRATSLLNEFVCVFDFGLSVELSGVVVLRFSECIISPDAEQVGFASLAPDGNGSVRLVCEA